MSAPTFSIIIPVYNVAPYLRECLDSVLAQTHTNWEAICVDDGSTDGSGQILDEYAAKDGRFKTIHQKNAGVSVARNAGLDNVNGDIVAFLDGDDCFSPTALLTASVALRNANIDAFRFRNTIFINGEKPIFNAAYDYKIVDYTILPNDALNASNLMTCRYFFRKTVCADVKYKPFICGEDRLFVFECLQMVHKVAISDACIYAYRQSRPGSYTTSVIKSEKGWRCELEYRIEFLDMLTRTKKPFAISGDNWLRPTLYKDYVIGCEDFSGEERKRLRVAWFAALPLLIRSPYFTAYQKFVLQVCHLFPFHCVDYVLCFVIPYFAQGGSLIGAFSRKLSFPTMSKRRKKKCVM